MQDHIRSGILEGMIDIGDDVSLADTIEKTMGAIYPLFTFDFSGDTYVVIFDERPVKLAQKVEVNDGGMFIPVRGKEFYTERQIRLISKFCHSGLMPKGQKIFATSKRLYAVVLRFPLGTSCDDFIVNDGSFMLGSMYVTLDTRDKHDASTARDAVFFGKLMESFMNGRYPTSGTYRQFRRAAVDAYNAFECALSKAAADLKEVKDANHRKRHEMWVQAGAHGKVVTDRLEESE